MAQQVLDDAGYSSLAFALARTEKHGKSPAIALADVAAMREVDTADSVAAVLRNRIELQLPAPHADTDAPLPWLADPALVSNCGSAWHTYVDTCAHAIAERVTDVSEQSDVDLVADQELLETAHRELFGGTDADSPKALSSCMTSLNGRLHGTWLPGYVVRPHPHPVGHLAETPHASMDRALPRSTF